MGGHQTAGGGRAAVFLCASGVSGEHDHEIGKESTGGRFFNFNHQFYPSVKFIASVSTKRKGNYIIILKLLNLTASYNFIHDIIIRVD